MYIGCPHFSSCSGCTSNFSENPPEIFERAKDFFFNLCGITLSLKRGPDRFWRTRAKLAVRHSPKDPRRPVIGLFEKNSHNVTEIPQCLVHHPRINEAIARLLKAFQKSSLTAYDESSHRGELRYLQCVVERRTQKVQLSLVLNAAKEEISPWLDFCPTLFTSSDDTFWHSIWLNCNQSKANAIFGKEWIKVIGHDFVWEAVMGSEFAFGPEHFGQSNLSLYEEMIRDILQRLKRGAHLAELYAGIGVMGICLAEKCQFVRLCEVQSQAASYFEIAKERQAYPLQKKLSYLVAPAERSFELLEGVDCCIVDPPRKGLGTATIDKLFDSPSLVELIYVSCDWNSLARDCQHIYKQHPEWRVKEAISYLFFPGTNQIETVAFLKREGNEEQ